MEPPEDEVKEGAPEWVVTFGDMMSLLLTFFILLLSFSQIQIDKFKAVAGYMKKALHVDTIPIAQQVEMGTTPIFDESSSTPGMSQSMITLEKVREAIEESGMKTGGTVEITDRGVALKLDGDMVFASGKARLKKEVFDLLDKVAAIANQQGGDIEIEGHTDDVAISTDRFPSNWELSSARAGAAARYLTRKGVPPLRIKAIGYADTRPLVPNDSPENRARNRRIEVLFLNVDEKKLRTRPVRPDPTGGEGTP